MDDPRLLLLKDEPPLLEEINKLVRSRPKAKKPKARAKVLPPAPRQKLPARVLRARARREKLANA